MMSVISAQSTARKLPAPTPTRIAPTTRTGGAGASAAIVIPRAPMAQRAVDDASCVRPAATVARPGSSPPPCTARRSSVVTKIHEARWSLSAIPSARSRYGTDRTIRNALPPRMKKREATRNRKLRSRRMSVPHASAAIVGQLRPPRSFALRPSSSRKKSESIVANSMTPRAIVGSVKSPITSPDRRERGCRSRRRGP